MWRAVLAFAGDPEVAADSVAEAFAQALRRGDAIRDPGRWVWRAAFRIAAGELKLRRTTTALGPPQGWYALDTEAMELIETLKRLPPKQRAAWPSTTVPDTRCGRSPRSSGPLRRRSECTSAGVVDGFASLLGGDE